MSFYLGPLTIPPLGNILSLWELLHSVLPFPHEVLSFPHFTQGKLSLEKIKLGSGEPCLYFSVLAGALCCFSDSGSCLTSARAGKSLLF